MMNFINNINQDALMASFELMGKGMLAIFVVMAVISLIVYLFTKLSK